MVYGLRCGICEKIKEYCHECTNDYIKEIRALVANNREPIKDSRREEKC